jgi:hypothetical protein
VTISLATGVLVFTPRPDALVPGWLYLAIFRVFVGLGNAGIYAIDLLWHRSLGGPTSENGCLCRGDGSPRTGQPQEVAHVACDLSA